MKPIRIALLIAGLAALVLFGMWWRVTQKTAGPVGVAANAPMAETSPDGDASAEEQAIGAAFRPGFGSQHRAVVAAFTTPISFHGRVIDQHGNPVAEADVRLWANDKASGRPSEYVRKTDADGRFSLGGAQGITLAVEVSKPGFRAIPEGVQGGSSRGRFEYGLSSRGPYQSSKDAPTTFVLHRPGPIEPLIKIGEKNFQIARDGTPLSIAVDQKGAHQVVLRCWTQDLNRPEGQRRYDWRLEIAVTNGALVARKGPFEFEAPASGYLARDTVEMPVLLQDQWRSFAERSYFIRFDDGTFARANLRMRTGGDHFVVWESHWNPNPNSRNLESDPTLDQKRQ